MSKYRSIWIEAYGEIPVDDQGRTYEIHHIDGNRDNNDISNLICVSIADHYRIHYEQGDYLACAIMSKRMELSKEEMIAVHKKAMSKRDQSGEKNPMYGRSAIKENNMKWYNDGTADTMFVENEQPDGYVAGRINMPRYDMSGKSNPRARKAIVNGKEYACLKDACIDYPNVPYSSMKNYAQRDKITKNKHGITARYV
jgi:hypothetical protein